MHTTAAPAIRAHVVAPHTRCNITVPLKAESFGPMLSPVPRGMERRNSSAQRHTASDNFAVFLRPRHAFMAGRATAIQDPKGEIRPLDCARVSNLLATSSARVETFRLVLSALAQERF